MMKHMKRSVWMIVLVVCLLVSLTGCSQLMSLMEDEELRGYTEAMLNAGIAKDFQAGYTLEEHPIPPVATQQPKEQQTLPPVEPEQTTNDTEHPNE